MICHFCKSPTEGNNTGSCKLCFAPIPVKLANPLTATYFIAPEDFSFDQAFHLQSILNAYAADEEWKHKQIVLPHGTEVLSECKEAK